MGSNAASSGTTQRPASPNKARVWNLLSSAKQTRDIMHKLFRLPLMKTESNAYILNKQT